MAETIHSEAARESSPYAAPAGDMPVTEYQELTRSIGAEGLREPIVLLNGQVLEGRHRYRACVETGGEPEFREFGGDPDDGEDPAAWALAHSARALSLAQTDRLHECERTIEQGIGTFIAVGNALLEVRDEGLWRGSHESFEAWSQERFDLGRRHADRTIMATQVVALLVDAGPPPRSEAVARELVPLREQPEEMRAAWSQAIETHGEKPTAPQVHDVVQARLPHDEEPEPESVAPVSTAPPADPVPTAQEQEFAGEPEYEDPNAGGDAPDSKLDDWGDEGKTGEEQDTGGIHAILGALDTIPSLPGAISLSGKMSSDQRQQAMRGLPGAITYLQTLQTALATGKQ